MVDVLFLYISHYDIFSRISRIFDMYHSIKICKKQNLSKAILLHLCFLFILYQRLSKISKRLRRVFWLEKPQSYPNTVIFYFLLR